MLRASTVEAMPGTWAPTTSSTRSAKRSARSALHVPSPTSTLPAASLVGRTGTSVICTRMTAWPAGARVGRLAPGAGGALPRALEEHCLGLGRWACPIGSLTAQMAATDVESPPSW